MAIRTLTMFGLLLATAAAVSAGELKGVQMPEQVVAEGKTLTLNGMGLREATMLKVSVYVAGLYLESRSSDAGAIVTSNQLKQIAMHFVRDVSAGQMRDSWTEGFDKQCPKPCTELKDRLATLNSYMSDLKTGDSMSFTWSPGRTEIHVRAKSMGVIAGDDFAKVMLSIWLGPNPPNKDLKEGLLGKKTAG
jgi:Chalcone isomerase-like